VRRGEDRHAIGAIALDLLFPERAATLGGIALGTPLTEVATRLGEGRVEGGTTVWERELEDPHGNGRQLTLRIGGQLGRAHRLEARLFSRDKLDVDAAWREVKDHLDAALGAPEKQVTGVLTFVWKVPGAYAGLTQGSRYRDDQGRYVLDLATRPADGVRFEGRPT
jgi:hypothetical protein